MRPGPLDRWMPTGGSKRGWTTWLAGAVDYHRVKGSAEKLKDLLTIFNFIYLKLWLLWS